MIYIFLSFLRVSCIPTLFKGISGTALAATAMGLIFMIGNAKGRYSCQTTPLTLDHEGWISTLSNRYGLKNLGERDRESVGCSLTFLWMEVVFSFTFIFLFDIIMRVDSIITTW